MKSIFGVTAVLLLSVILCGCAKKSSVFEEPTIEICSDGSILRTMVESFDKPYYDVEELKTEYERALSDYNSGSNPGKVSLNDIHALDKEVFISLEYENCEAGSAFDGCELFWGSVQNASAGGYFEDTTLKGVKDAQLVEGFDAAKLNDKNVFVTDESGIVIFPKNVIYVSANVEVLSDKEVRISSDSSGLAVIVTE